MCDPAKRKARRPQPRRVAGNYLNQSMDMVMGGKPRNSAMLKRQLQQLQNNGPSSNMTAQDETQANAMSNDIAEAVQLRRANAESASLGTKKQSRDLC